MSKPLEYVEKLARRARHEEAPQGDVSRRVLSRLTARESVLGAPMFVFATGYAALASAALVYGYILMQAMSDPLLSVFQQASIVMP